ncbi:MAG TPA: hypothetical protein VMT11_17660 [Myxococcaceae bacterium]|nr:hypothetical protein [Myxococcaceae bacterium]
MAKLKRILRELTREIERIAERNEMLERRLESITGALRGTLRAPGTLAGRMVREAHARAGSGSRRGAPTRFDDSQAVALRREYERGATSAQLARKYKAALPTILSTLRRAGTTLRRGRPRRRPPARS